MIQRIPPHDSRRFRQLERVLLLIELLSPLRRGATAEELRRDVSDLMGEPFCLRTIYRDMQVLEAFGIIERDAGGQRDQARWRCRTQSIRVAVHRAAAELRSELRDPWPVIAGQGGGPQP